MSDRPDNLDEVARLELLAQWYRELAAVAENGSERRTELRQAERLEAAASALVAPGLGKGKPRNRP